MVRAAVAFWCRSAADAGSTAITARATERRNSATVCPGARPSTRASTAVAAVSSSSRTAETRCAACR